MKKIFFLLITVLLFFLKPTELKAQCGDYAEWLTPGFNGYNNVMFYSTGGQFAGGTQSDNCTGTPSGSPIGGGLGGPTTTDIYFTFNGTVNNVEISLSPVHSNDIVTIFANGSAASLVNNGCDYIVSGNSVTGTANCQGSWGGGPIAAGGSVIASRAGGFTTLRVRVQTTACSASPPSFGVHVGICDLAPIGPFCNDANDFNINYDLVSSCVNSTQYGNQVTFSPIATEFPAVSGTIYTWNFGSGASPATYTGEFPPPVTWTTPGPKTVTMTMTAPGCSSVVKTITYDVGGDNYSSTAIDINPNQPTYCTNSAMQFSAPAPVYGVGSYFWTFGAGASIASSTSPTPTVSWSTTGLKTVNLTMYDNAGCEIIREITVQVNSCSGTPCTTPSCSASGPASGTTGNTYSFTAGSIVPSGSTVTWVSSGGGLPASGTGTTANVSWSTTGAKTVTFTVVNNSVPSGCSPSASSTCVANINVTSGGGTPCTTPSCSASGPGSGTTGSSYTFTAGSVTPVGSTVTWVSNGGGFPASGSGSTANVSWSTTGVKSVIFTVVNNSVPSGCSPSASSTCQANILISGGGGPLVGIVMDDINQTQMNVPVSGRLLYNDYNMVAVIAAVQGGINIPIGTPTAITGGTITINSDGTYTFTPATGFVGSVPPITYTAQDANGNPLTAELYIEVSPLENPAGNNPPIANHDTAVAEHGETITVFPRDNDSDLDGDTITTTGIAYNGTQISTNPLAPTTIVVGGSNAGVAYRDVNGNLVFTPNAGFTGDVLFTYTITDGNGGTDNSTINIYVRPDVSASIHANDDANSAPQGTTMIGNVLSNDQLEGTAPQVNAATATYNGITYTIPIGTPTNIPGAGTVTLNANGTYTFVPDPNFIGTLPVQYLVINKEENSDVATLYLTTIEEGAPPMLSVAYDDMNQTFMDVPVTGNLIVNDINVASVFRVFHPVTGLQIPFGVATAVPGGTITFNSNGDYTFVPEAGFIGDVTPITYTATNGAGLSNAQYINAQLFITVIGPIESGVNNPPIANHDTATCEQSGTVTVRPMFNDSHIDGATISVTTITYNGTAISTNAGAPTTIMVGGNVAGTAYRTPSGNLVFTASATFAGEALFNYSITDGNGGTADSTINITVVADQVNAIYAHDDALTFRMGTPQVVYDNVLVNDQLEGTNPLVTTVVFVHDGIEYPAVVGTPITIPGVGSITMENNGGVKLVPLPTFYGNIQARYTVCNNEGNCDTATLYMTSVKSCSLTFVGGTPDGYTNTGITTLASKRLNWPNDVPNGFIALESKTKGFVITRTTAASISAPVEGMLIYDTTDKCFKLYNGTTWNCIAKTCLD